MSWLFEGKTYTLFLDLDGVLADFDAGVRKILGKSPSELPEKEMWPILARTKNFYANLDWMPDGKEFFKKMRNENPVIVTGVPWGNWADAQKIAWCKRELGHEVRVITCKSKEKGRAAMDFIKDGEIPVLVDDRIKAREGWLDIGGIFILHTGAKTSLEELTQLGFDS